MITEFLEAYGVTLIFAMAFLYIIVYFIGSFKNRKLMRAYAKAIKDHMSPRSTFTGFRPFGSRGFRALCQMKENENLKKIEVAVTLVDRQNIMHYPLAPITHDYDRIICWAYPRTKPHNTIEIVPSTYHKTVKLPQKMKTVSINWDRNKEYSVMSESDSYPKALFKNKKLWNDLVGMKTIIKKISIDKYKETLYLISRVKEETIPTILDLVVELGDRIVEFSGDRGL